MADLKVIEPRQPPTNPNVIDILQGLLMQAESGVLQSLGVVCVYSDRECSFEYACRDGNYTDLMAQATLMQADLIAEIRGVE